MQYPEVPEVSVFWSDMIMTTRQQLLGIFLCFLFCRILALLMPEKLTDAIRQRDSRNKQARIYVCT